MIEYGAGLAAGVCAARIVNVPQYNARHFPLYNLVYARKFVVFSDAHTYPCVYICICTYTCGAVRGRRLAVITSAQLFVSVNRIYTNPRTACPPRPSHPSPPSHCTSEHIPIRLISIIVLYLSTERYVWLGTN